jgi:hypothetical protein
MHYIFAVIELLQLTSESALGHATRNVDEVINNFLKSDTAGKAIPAQTWTGPEGSVPRFPGNLHMNVVNLSPLRIVRPEGLSQ